MEEVLVDDVDEPTGERRDTTPAFARGTLEIELVERDRATERNVEEDHLAEIVHDLKAPLATIALDVTLFDHRVANGESVDARPILARVLHNVDFLERMVDDLLDGWSSDPARPPRRSTDLRALLTAVIARAVCARDRSRVRLDALQVAWVMVDEHRIERVVANLLSNALKYSGSGEIVVRLDTYGHTCCVSVTDSGPGVTQAEAGFIFDKYRRTHSACGHRGSGLGLYVSRKIIEDHGGVMGVHSIPGEGSRFFFQLALS